MEGGSTSERRSGGMKPSFLLRPKGLADREMVQLGGGIQYTDTSDPSGTVHGYSSFSAGRHAQEAADGEDGASSLAAGAAPPIAGVAAAVRSSGGARLGSHPPVAKTVNGGILLGGYRGDVGTQFRLDSLTAARSRRRARSGLHPDQHLSNLMAGGEAMMKMLGVDASQGYGIHAESSSSSELRGQSNRASVLKVSATLPAESASHAHQDYQMETRRAVGFSGTIAQHYALLKVNAAAEHTAQAARTAGSMDRRLYTDTASHSSVTFGTVVTLGSFHRAVPAFVVNVSHKDTIATVKSAGVPIVSRAEYLSESKAVGQVDAKVMGKQSRTETGALQDALDLPPRRGTGLLSLGLNTPMAQASSRNHNTAYSPSTQNPRMTTASEGPSRQGVSRSGDRWIRDAHGGVAVGANCDLVLLDHCELREPRNVAAALTDRNENASSLSLRSTVVSDAALTVLPSLTPFVSTLDMSGASGFTRAAAAAAFASLPNLRCVRLAGCDFLFKADGGVSQAASTAGDTLASSLVGTSASGRGPGFALVGSLAQLSLEPGRLETFAKQSAAISAQQVAGSASPRAASSSLSTAASHIAKAAHEPGLFVVRKRGQRTQVFENVRSTDAWVPRVLPAARASGTAGDEATNRSTQAAQAAGVSLQPADSVGSDPPAAPPVALLAHAPESAMAAAVSASAATAGGATAAAGSAVSSDSKDTSLARFAGNGRDMLLQLVRAPRNLHELSLSSCPSLTDDALFTLLKAATSDTERQAQQPFLEVQQQALEAVTGVRIRSRRQLPTKSDTSGSLPSPLSASPAAGHDDLLAMNEMREKMGLKAVTASGSPAADGGSQHLLPSSIPVDRSIEGMLSAMAPYMTLEWQAAVVTAHAQLARIRSQQQWRQGVGGFADKKESDEDLLQRQIAKLAEDANRRPGAKQSAAQEEESDESESDDEAYISNEDFGPIPHDWYRIKRLATFEARPSLGTVLPPESALPVASPALVQAAYGDAILARIPRGGMLDLEILDLSGCTMLGDAAMYFIGAHCPKLTHISLRGCSQPCLTDRGLFGLTHRGLPRMLSLDLSGCTQLTSAAVRAVAFNCPLLEEFNLAGCVSLDEKACYAIAYAPCAASLRSIDVTRGEKLTAVPILRLLQSCPNLSIINLTLCTSISASEVNLLAQAVPSVTVVRMPDDAYAKSRAASLVHKYKPPAKEDRFETKIASMMVTRKRTKKSKRK